MHYSFVEIGTSNYSAKIQHCPDDVYGISVEPVAELLKELPNKPRVKKVQAAISDYDGTGEIYSVPQKFIRRYGLFKWVVGCNSLEKPHKAVLSRLKKRGLDQSIIQKSVVQVMTIETLFDKYKVASLDMLKIDTEGHDCVILNSYMDLLEKGGARTDKILFEANSLTDQAIIDQTIQRLGTHDYVVTGTFGDDVFLKSTTKKITFPKMML